MIRAFIAVNLDGHILTNSLLGFPASIMDNEELQCVCSDTLMVATMDVVPKCLPPHLAMVTRKSLLAEAPANLATMVSNLVNEKGIGDISVLANDDILYAMDLIGCGYELAIVCPEEAEVPGSLTLGKEFISSVNFDVYKLMRYRQSVASATDTQIADAIDGMESYFNMIDSMDKRDKDAMDKIAKGVRMLNQALKRESAGDNLMYGEGGEFTGTAEFDEEEEFDHLWDSMQLMADQLNQTTELVVSTQETVGNIFKYFKENAPINQIRNRFNLMNEEIAGLRNQIGAHIAEDKKDELNGKLNKTAPIIWVLLAVSTAALLLGVINLLL